MTDQLRHSIKRAISFLAKEQQEDGGFSSLSSADAKSFENAQIRYRTTFTASLILQCLNNASNYSAETKNTRGKLASLLLKQKSPGWSFNYWYRQSEEAHTHPLPDDLDDTFCALSALFSYDDELLTPSALACTIHTLLDVEVKPGGPYKTWVVSKKADSHWHDVDSAVNSNIAFFLSLQGIRLPAINDLQKTAIDLHAYNSRYYASIYPIMYFIQRSYLDDKSKLVRFLTKKRNKDGHWGNSLNTALALSVLLMEDADRAKLDRAIQYLLNEQQKDGSWPACTFCLDPLIDNVAHYSGSSALTTAFCIEALACYESEPKYISTTSTAEKIEQQVMNCTTKLLSFQEKEARQFVQDLVARLSHDPDKQVVLLPYWTSLAIGKEVNEPLSVDLGTASLLGWIAYDIYDNFLDGEGESMNLPVANRALRHMTSLFTVLGKSYPEFNNHFELIMNKLEQANLTEIIGQEQPIDFKQLSNKSLGHALSSLAVVYASIPDVESEQINHLISFFKHYLNARQMYDDMHDWELDLSQGRITETVRYIMDDADSEDIVSLQSMREQFWNSSFQKLNAILSEELSSAKNHLDQMTILHSPQYLGQFLEHLQSSVQKSNNTQSLTKKFISSYLRQR